MYKLSTLFFCLFVVNSIKAETLIVGPNAAYQRVQDASQDAQPGDTILVLEGEYQQREGISNLNGTAYNWIVIAAERIGAAHFSGTSEAFHLSNCSFVKIIGFDFYGLSANGVNIDDGGTFDTPTHHIKIEHCTFRDMNASGNNDLLKLSGLDDFFIYDCIFRNGANGGSGVDMVGCHNGIIRGNRFENLGSSGIQAKGGTQFITIEQNQFVDAGLRALNLGGSTGLAFFRPQDAPFEAADLQVKSNTFIGAHAPIAYVGCTRVDVENNTIYLPDNWVIRILQETVDPSRFVSCGDNAFRNNIVVIDNGLSREVNIGPNTRPETFLFENNLWFNRDVRSWPGPNLPTPEMNGVIQEEPVFVDAANEDFALMSFSPAIGEGKELNDVTFDFNGKRFDGPPSIGALEGGEQGASDFAPEGAEWYYDEIHRPTPRSNYYRLISEGDTIVEHRQAKLIKYFFGNHRGEERNEQGDYVVYGEEEQVYLYDGEDYVMLYDFASTADTLTSHVNASPLYIVGEPDPDESKFFKIGVSTRAIIPIDGEMKKQVFVSQIQPEDINDPCYDFQEYLLEDIGSVNVSPFGESCGKLLGGFYGKLRCYSDDEIMYMHQTKSCDTVYIPTAINNITELGFRASPNPSIGTIEISGSQGGAVQIYDLLGKEVEQHKKAAERNISITLKPGSYILLISNQNGSQSLPVFVVE